MHIAQFIQRYPPALGGSEAYISRLCEYLATCGDEVRVWTSDAVELEEMWKGRITPSTSLRMNRVEEFGFSDPSPLFSLSAPPYTAEGPSTVLHLRRYPPLHFPARRYFLKVLSLLPHRFWQCLTTPCNPICLAMWRDANHFDGPLDAVHATAFPYSFPIACGLRLARRRGVPFLLTPFLHLGDPTNPHDRTRKQYTSPHLRWLLKQADRVFVQTSTERNAAISLGVPENRVVLQGLGVEMRECTGGDRVAARSIWRVQTDETVIGHLANNSAEKGTVDLLRAAERAWETGHHFRVVLAGPEMPSFRDFWKTFRFKDHVTRLGILTEVQKRDFFAGIDCFALPSRCDSFGLVLLEAWANGKPNLVYRAGGPAELVQHEIDGLQSACGDVAELTTNLRRLIIDPAFRLQLGENGLSRVLREFRWQDKLELVHNTIRDSLSCRVSARRVMRSTPCQIAS